jgi:hypothetical protein
MENKENKDIKATDWAQAFNDPFKSGLIKADAIDKILANKELAEKIKNLKF